MAKDLVHLSSESQRERSEGTVLKSAQTFHRFTGSSVEERLPFSK